MIRLFVGLGNPGVEYEDTRHNAGFAYIDALAKHLKVSMNVDKAYFGLLGRGTVQGSSVWLLQPQTFMNRSGQSVGALARFFKITPEEILVAHDELDIDAGATKLKSGGGHAGHNGLRDIHAHLGSPNYWRLRLGIGHPGDKSEVANYVLRKAPVTERALLSQSIDKAIGATEAFITGDMTKATRLIHASEPKPKPLKSNPKPMPKTLSAEENPATGE